MPYEGEYAGYTPLRRLASEERIKEMLGGYRLREPVEGEEAEAIEYAQVIPSDWLPKWVVAIDGSHLEVPVQNGFPGAEASYVTVASVLIEVSRMMALGHARPVDPCDFRELEKADSIDCALPGCNVISIEAGSAEESLRSAMYQVLRHNRMTTQGETLLDTYEALLGYKPTGSV